MIRQMTITLAFVFGLVASSDAQTVRDTDPAGLLGARNTERTFTDIAAGLPGVHRSSAAWGDYDNDGDPDLALAGHGESDNVTSIYRNDGGNTFTDIGAGLTAVRYAAVSWGDYDNDGDLDLALAGYTGSVAVSKVYRNDGDDTFTDIGAGLTGLFYACLSWGDYDNDGDLDLAIAGWSSAAGFRSYIYRNDGVGTFTSSGASLTGVCFCSLSWGDYDNDGDLDLAIAGSDGDGVRRSKIYRNDGGSTFTDIGAGLTAVRYASVSWGDYDNDGDLDLALAGEIAGGNVTQVYRNDGGGTFVDIGAGLAGLGHSSLSWGDYDNDGNLDLAVAGDSGSGYLSKVYRNDGSGTFTDIVADLTAISDCSLSWGDYDNDGDVDLALAGDTGSGYVSRIYRNDAPGIFTDILAGLPGVHRSSAAWGDYDNDGDLDLALAGHGESDNVTSIYRNDGGNTFTDIGAGLTAVRYAAVSWGDYDNDGDLDLALAGYLGEDDAQSKIYRNNGDDTFTDIGAGLTGLFYACLSWGDYDNDGDLDLAIAGWSSAAGFRSYIYRNDGGGTFTSSGASLTGVCFCSLSWGDYDNDGDLDLAIAGSDGDGVRRSKIYRNDGGSTFTDIGAGLTAVRYASVSWGDYDNDGDLDLALAGEIAGGYVTQIYRNDGGGTFVDIAAGLAGLGHSSLSWGDYDNDGDLDLAVAGDSGSSYLSKIYRNDGGGTFADIGADLTAVSDCSLSWGDYDDDGDLDLALAGNSGSGIVSKIYRNNGGGPVTNIDAGLTGVYYASLSWGDYDNDGDLDVALAGYTVGSVNVSNIYRNDGDNTFTDLAAGLTPVRYAAVDWGDYDNDGDLDLALAGYTGSAAVSKIYRNNGDDTFTDIGAGLTGLFYASLSWGDYDNDGDVDLALAGWSSPAGYRTYIYRNNGNGTFTNSGASLTGLAFCSLAWGDYDNDGDLDLAIAGFDGGGVRRSKIYRNDGGSTFTDIGAALTAVRYAAVSWGDYDNDGDLDLVLAGEGGGGYVSQIYRNDGADTFVDIAAGLAGLGHSCLSWGDYDNDGDLDLAVAGYGGTRESKIYRNEGGGTFTDIAAPLTAVSDCSLSWGDYDHDGDLDLAQTGSVSIGGGVFVSEIYAGSGRPFTLNTPPEAPEGLTAEVTDFDVTFSWDATSDIQTPAAGLSYNLRMGTTAESEEICCGMADLDSGWRRIVATGNTQKRLTWTLLDVPPGIHQWTIQAIDSGFAGSAWATVQPVEFCTPVPGGDCNDNGIHDACETLPTILYVDHTATDGLNDGTSWTDAFVELSEAVTFAACTGEVTEVRVAQGTYLPGTARSDTFQLINGTRIAGGYAGLGAPDPDERDVELYETILSGDIGTPDDISDNSQHVVTGSGTDATAVLDGFTVTAGYAYGGDPYYYGAGMLNAAGTPTVLNCTFIGNAASSGGGMYNINSDGVTLINCSFQGNSCTGYGAGIHHEGSTMTLINCTFTGNAGKFGGGMTTYVGSHTTLINCTFHGNTATIPGGGGGAVYMFTGNLTVANCVLWGNAPDQIYPNGPVAVSYSIIQGGWTGTGNIDADPMFLDAGGGDLRLRCGSPGIDAGDNAAVPGDIPTDLAGEPRFVDDPGVTDTGAGDPPIVDMGAYEQQLDSSSTLYVPADYGTIQGAIVKACAGAEIVVSPGTYNEAIDFLGKAITLHSAEGRQATTIDATGLGQVSVVTCSSGEGPDTILEGFTITGGTGTVNPSDEVIEGGGMLTVDSSPTVTDCTFTGNVARRGGGMHNNNSSPTITNCTFTENEAEWGGGGMSNYLGSHAALTNCRFEGNSVVAEGYGGAGVHNSESNPTLTNCTVVGNSGGDYGGGMVCRSGSHPTVTNCTFSGNTADVNSGAVRLDGADVTLGNCVLWGNSPDQIGIASGTATVTYSDVQGGWTGTGNISDDPTLDVDGLHLLDGSPCINAGDPGGDYTDQTDIDGEERVQQCRVDMGADETPFFVEDCNDNGLDDLECDLGQGTSEDCNGNVVPDECDIADGTSQDCQSNGIPDECDIAQGTSTDVNENSIPDECDPVPPAAEPGGPGCSVPGDCTDAYAGADCVGGTCYIPKNRYLTIDPTVNEEEVAYQVEIVEAVDYPTAVGLTWWLDEPVCYDYPNGDPVLPAPPACEGADRFGWVSSLTDTMVARVWVESPVNIGACPTAPVVTFEIRASADDGASFSPNGLVIGTAHKPAGESQSWGDITGGPVEDMPGLWLAPERATNLADVQAGIRTFENRTEDTACPPRPWVDMEINQVINLADIQFVIGAFEGAAYTDLPDLEFIGLHPADCP